VSAALIVNFNAPELNQLALELVNRGGLQCMVRPYVNKGRGWERMLARLPGLGSRYAATLGRRCLASRALAELTVEAGVVADLGAALALRASFLSPMLRQQWGHSLHEAVRTAVSRRAGYRASSASAVVSYPGFARDAFAVAKRRGTRCIVSYPIAHHRYHLALRAEEAEREPEFASTWPELTHFTSAYLDELDAEIDAADCVLVGSEFVARSFAAEGVDAKRIAVVPYGVDLSVFGESRPPRPAGPFRAVFVGQIGQRKGLSYLLKGYAAFARDDTRLSLIGHIVGSSAPLTPYRDIVEHLPHLTRPKLAATLRGCDVFVFPTLLEGMPLVVLEAMACGLPVIATANGPDQVVRDGIDGFIVPSRDPEAITDRLERLRSDPALCAQMGRNAAARAACFTWATFARRAADLLEDAGV